MNCNLAYNCLHLVNQCVVSLAQLAMMFPDSYELILSETHDQVVTRQVDSDLEKYVVHIHVHSLIQMVVSP